MIDAHITRENASIQIGGDVHELLRDSAKILFGIYQALQRHDQNVANFYRHMMLTIPPELFDPKPGEIFLDMNAIKMMMENRGVNPESNTGEQESPNKSTDGSENQ